MRGKFSATASEEVPDDRRAACWDARPLLGRDPSAGFTLRASASGSAQLWAVRVSFPAGIPMEGLASRNLCRCSCASVALRERVNTPRLACWPAACSLRPAPAVWGRCLRVCDGSVRSRRCLPPATHVCRERVRRSQLLDAAPAVQCRSCPGRQPGAKPRSGRLVVWREPSEGWSGCHLGLRGGGTRSSTWPGANEVHRLPKSGR